MFVKFKSKIAILLATAMLFTCTGNIYAVDEHQYDTDVLTMQENDGIINHNGKIVSKNDSINLSGIEIMVLDSQLVAENDGICEYDNEYVYSVFTNSEGEYEFKIPSNEYLIEINLDTLPLGTGVSQTSFFSYGNNRLFEVFIDYIADIELNNESGFNSIDLLNEDKELLNTSYTTDISVSDSSMMRSFNILDNKDTLTVVNSVQTDMLSESYDIDIDISEYSIMDKVNLAEELNVIDEKQKIEFIVQYYNTLDTDDIWLKDDLFDILYDFQSENIDSYDPKVQELNQIIETLSADDKSISDYYTYPNGKSSTNIANTDYRIHYEPTVSSDTINLYKSEFKKIYDYLSANGFPGLIHDKAENSSTSRYNIYLVPASAISGSRGKTVPVDSSDMLNKGSFIILPVKTTLTDDTKKTIAHELFHATMYTYREGQPLSYFSEAMANWFGTRYVGVKTSTAETGVIAFMNSTHLPLRDTSNDRHYGGLVFPQYIEIKWGLNGVKNVLEAMNGSANNAYTWYKTGLEESGTTYKTAWGGCAAYNAQASTFYKRSSGTPYGWQNAKRTTTQSLTNQRTIASTILEPSSARYYEYTPATATSKTATIKITISDGSYADASFGYYTKKQSGSTLTLAAPMTSNTRTITIPNFGTTVTGYTLIAANTNTSLTAGTMTFTATNKAE